MSDRPETLRELIEQFPDSSGIYVFRDAEGTPLYVGKAKSLRKRAANYLSRDLEPRLARMVESAASIDYVASADEAGALLLENNWIKRHRPRYNVLLRDDKTYPYLQLTVTEPAPRVLVARRVERDGNVYAGPFMPALVARRTMSLTHRLFGIRSCNEVIDGKRARPCLEYDIKRCLAPCVASICSLERYREAVDQAQLLIEGRQDELIDRLHADMTLAASEERYERAAQLRDAIRTIETVRDRLNRVETPAMGDRDAFGELATRFEPMVYAIALRRLGNHSEAQELCQEVLVKAMQKIEQLKVPAAFGGWLRSITVRMAINRQVRRAPMIATEPQTLDATCVESSTPLSASGAISRSTGSSAASSAAAQITPVPIRASSLPSGPTAKGKSVATSRKKTIGSNRPPLVQLRRNSRRMMERITFPLSPFALVSRSPEPPAPAGMSGGHSTCSLSKG